jgi:hypothetical protein
MTTTTTTETIDLLITFFEQERDFVQESAESMTHSKVAKLIILKRYQWFNTLVGVLKEAKTDEGVIKLKEAIEREKQRKAGKL